MSLIEQLRGEVRGTVAMLGLVPPFTVNQFVPALEATWGWPILLAPFTRPRGMRSRVTGLSGICNGRFIALYCGSGSAAQQEQIQYHELSHLILGHISDDSSVICMRDGPIADPRERLVEAFARELMFYARYGHMESAPERPVPAHVAQQFLHDLRGR